MTASTDQAAVTRAYERLAPFYDVYDGPMEWLGMARRRRRLLSRAQGCVLEVGVGTGSNLGYYPPGIRVLGIDVSRRMLDRAGRRPARSGVDVRLEQADVQRLPFADGTFDTVVATCVFCSVPDPVRGLTELGRVVKPGGQVLLLEHVRPSNRLLGALADALSPLTRRLFGFNLNRRTEENTAAAGLRLLEVRRSGIWRDVVATSADHTSSRSTGGDSGERGRDSR